VGTTELRIPSTSRDIENKIHLRVSSGPLEEEDDGVLLSMPPPSSSVAFSENNNLGTVINNITKEQPGKQTDAIVRSQLMNEGAIGTQNTRREQEDFILVVQ
jgi:hypothetical protein